MDKFQFPIKTLTCQACVLLLVLSVAPSSSMGQATTPSNDSSSAGSTKAVTKVSPASSQAPEAESKSADIPAAKAPPSAEEKNRKALEERAGKDAGKLLL